MIFKEFIGERNKELQVLLQITRQAKYDYEFLYDLVCDFILQKVVNLTLEDSDLEISEDKKKVTIRLYKPDFISRPLYIYCEAFTVEYAENYANKLKLIEIIEISEGLPGTRPVIRLGSSWKGETRIEDLTMDSKVLVLVNIMEFLENYLRENVWMQERNK